jgi:thiamine-phosphate pyrophosphorylase
MVISTSPEFTTADKESFLGSASLYVLVDSVDYLNQSSAPQLKRLIASLVSAGVHLIQLRDKRLNDRQLIEVGKQMVQLTRGSNTKFVMNDRVDLALVTNADGVHLGQEDLALKDAIEILGADKIIGISTHTLLQARQATEQGADYIGIGPVFPSATKSFDQFIGPELLAGIAQAVTVTAFAIGGIDLTNVDQVIAAGIRRVAVGSSVCNAVDPHSAAVELLKRLRSS